MFGIAKSSDKALAQRFGVNRTPGMVLRLAGRMLTVTALDCTANASCLSGWLAVWLAVCLSVWLAGWLSVCLSGCLSGWLSGWLAVCLACWLSVCLSVCLAGWLSGWLAGWLAGCLAGCLAGWLSGWLFVCLSLSLPSLAASLRVVCVLFPYRQVTPPVSFSCV